MNRYLERLTGFMGATEDYAEADVVLVGIPMDFTVSFRPGSRMGPQQIRLVSYGIEEYSVYQDKDLIDKKYYDAGDIALPFGNVTGSLERIEEVAADLLQEGKKPIFIGGEHLVTYPIVKPFADRYADLAVIHFDAHADLRTDYLGETNSHATVIRKVVDLIGGDNVYQFGIRSGTREEFAFARENTHMYVDEIFPALQKVVDKLKGRPVYVTLDIDVLDPAYAPGTGTPEPGGCTPREMFEAMRLLGQLDIVGFDLVEVAPSADLSDRTSLLAAKVIREAILSFW
ncbi:agmatinase [Heliorestis convoluta]|uniref:Agmatinase n=2 Tax=Heliorestis convoluta TaxID=356322 RepID=A0A5Q2N555_9FIRM|nr:agmatinase [Heliorestis convoluta]